MTTPELPAREAMEFDTVIVGAGPAGLAAAIRLKQLAPERTVVVVEKGSEVGAHILSGAVIDPIGLDRLIPEWRGEDTPIKTAVSADHFYALGPSGALRLPNFLLPPLMSNHGNFIVSLGDVCPIWRKRPKRSASRSIRALPQSKCCSRMVPSPVSPPATWVSARTGTISRASPAAWNCAANTPCSPRARAAA